MTKWELFHFWVNCSFKVKCIYVSDYACVGVIRYVQLTVRLKGALFPDSSAFSAMQMMGPLRSVRRTSVIVSSLPVGFRIICVPSTTKGTEPLNHL